MIQFRSSAAFADQASVILITQDQVDSKRFDFNEKTTKHGYIFQHDKLKGQILPHVPKPHGREKKF